MKVFISADIEGIAGIADWNETDYKRPEYAYYRSEMTKEVNAVCEGATISGANEILIKDAHGSGRNIDHMELQKDVKLIRSFNDHPFCMMFGVDNTFDAAIMIGYHSLAGSDGSPLAHTMTLGTAYIKINGELASEFMINAYTAAYVKVPVVCVIGDEALCNHVKEFNPNIKTVSLNKGVGKSVICPHPKASHERIKEGVKESLKSDINKCKLELPEYFEVEISYKDHTKAYKSSFYPGMQQLSPTNLMFSSNDYFEVLRMLSFTL
ncbi:MAG: M55 family metallopeptidase [Ignavibacteriales bacterium]